MRQQKSWIFSAYLFLVLFSGWSFSEPTLNENDFKVLVWTNKVLFTTFSASYADKERLLIHQYYSKNSWDALTEFFAPYVREINEQKLTLHPISVGVPQVRDGEKIRSGNFFKGVRYWVVNEEFNIPELDLTVSVEALVIEKKPNSDLFLIHSLSMRLNPNHQGETDQ